MSSVGSHCALGVVIPTLNEAATLPALLARLMHAEGEGDRADVVVVADGGSDDGTRTVATEHGAVLVDAPRGRGSQLAAGAERLASDVLLFLHADCTPAPGALSALRAAYGDSDVNASAMNQRVDASGRFYRLVERAANARCRRGMVLGDSGLAVRRDVYRAVGGFRPVRIFEDVDFSRRLKGHAPVHFLSQAVLHISARRWKGEGALRCTLRNWMLRTMYGAGVGADRLERLYPPHSPTASS